MKRLPKAQSRLCPDSQISSAIIPAQSPAAHNQPHETDAWVIAHALGLETDIPLGGYHNENIPWHSCIRQPQMKRDYASLTRQYLWYHPKNWSTKCNKLKSYRKGCRKSFPKENSDFSTTTHNTPTGVKFPSSPWTSPVCSFCVKSASGC